MDAGGPFRTPFYRNEAIRAADLEKQRPSISGAVNCNGCVDAGLRRRLQVLIGACREESFSFGFRE